MTGFESKRDAAADKLQEDLLNYGTAWSQDGKRIDPMSVYKEPVTEREALKLALEALEAMQMYAAAERKGLRICDEAITAIKEALAQPAQEPVALVIDGVLVKSALPEKYTGHLYTAPPQREWVGLTDDDMGQWIEEEHDVLRWAEAKLKEKNNGT